MIQMEPPLALVLRSEPLVRVPKIKIALLIEYDGTNFAGWQTQASIRTVQAELEIAFSQIFGEQLVVNGAGRTDTGVHARGMVAHVEVPETADLYKLIPAINGTTGRDVVIREIRNVPQNFHARHSASSREYAYTIDSQRTALERHISWSMQYQVDKVLMQSAAGLLIGEHDFTSFSKCSLDVKHYRCIVERSEWEEHGTKFVLWLRANRFVRGMVRGLVGAMVEVGRGRSSLDEFRDRLEQPDEFARASNLAPAKGLVLERVRYPEIYQLW
jgi:tRNA pseudouridine38-40 synthase